jgi:hypothetical protein
MDEAGETTLRERGERGDIIKRIRRDQRAPSLQLKAACR